MITRKVKRTDLLEVLKKYPLAANCSHFPTWAPEHLKECAKENHVWANCSGYTVWCMHCGAYGQVEE